MTQLGQIFFANVPSLPASQFVRQPSIGNVAFTDLNQNKPIEAESDLPLDPLLQLPVTNLNVGGINNDLEKLQLATDQLINSWDISSSSQTKPDAKSELTVDASVSSASGQLFSQQKLPLSKRSDTSITSPQLPSSTARNSVLGGPTNQRFAGTSISRSSTSDSELPGASASLLTWETATNIKRKVDAGQQPGLLATVTGTDQSKPTVTPTTSTEGDDTNPQRKTVDFSLEQTG